jgi:hypothetical protein
MIARSTKQLLAVALVVTAGAGCAAGPIRGQLSLPGQPLDRATISYESSLFGKTGKLWTTLPSGERFAGPYVLDPTARDRTMVATLTGDRGGQMVCRFTLNEPGVGPDSGGRVTCLISSGGTFDAQF